MAHSIYERYKELYDLPFEMKDDYYHGKEIITIAQMIKDEFGDNLTLIAVIADKNIRYERLSKREIILSNLSEYKDY